MKKIILAGGLLLSVLTTYSQSDNYGSVGTWGTIGPNHFTDPPSCPMTPAAPWETLGTISITGGRVVFNAVRAATQSRISKSLGTTYDSQFNLDFTFQITSSGTGNGFFPIAISSQNLDPIYVLPMVTCMQFTPMDVIAVNCITPGIFSPLNPGVSLFIMDNGVVVPSPAAMVIPYDVPIFARIRVYDNERGEFLLYSDAARRTLLNSSCFDLPNTVRDFAFMQHSTNAGGSAGRVSTGWLDDSNIYNTPFDCCNIRIVGPQTICSGDSTNTFSIITNGTDPQFEVPPGVTLVANGDGTFRITDWGELTSFTLTATSICRCEEISSELEVSINSIDANFNISGLGTSGSFLSNFSAISDATPTGSEHTWRMFTSNASGTSLTTVRGPISQISTGSGSTFSINATTPSPTLVTAQWYKILHTVISPDSLCMQVDSAVFRVTISGIIENPSMSKRSGSTIHVDTDISMSGVKIFPNPATSLVNIESENMIDEWELVDGSGKTLIKEKGGRKSLQINLSAYPSGLYIIKLHSAGQIITEKITLE